MGCNSSKSAVIPLDPDTSDVSITARTPQGLAFEIPLRDEEEESIIKKHPPKRLRMLEEQQASPPTLEELEEKLAEAEQRRQQILSQRVASARAAQKLKRNGENKSKIERMYQEPGTVEL
ncbi:uncharacterized protein LOC128991452 [Macrosteles quadrilineatus]|uniref:uncharacterized protein LOC128991452 n=1 Tax=Macrosteles quadrilineatus TaxID=74068 RepID=UPI0023E1C978|nr:uncharacterized protein LOC128991452 [Macrosteles quadrilineatus]